MHSFMFSQLSFFVCLFFYLRKVRLVLTQSLLATVTTKLLAVSVYSSGSLTAQIGPKVTLHSKQDVMISKN